MHGEVSTARLHLLRFAYLLTVGVVGAAAWPEVFRHASACNHYIRALGKREKACNGAASV